MPALPDGVVHCSTSLCGCNACPQLLCDLQEVRQSEEEKAKEQEQAANAYLHLNSYLALPAPAAPGGGVGGAGYGGMPPQF